MSMTQRNPIEMTFFLILTWRVRDGNRETLGYSIKAYHYAKGVFIFVRPTSLVFYTLS